MDNALCQLIFYKHWNIHGKKINSSANDVGKTEYTHAEERNKTSIMQNLFKKSTPNRFYINISPKATG